MSASTVLGGGERTDLVSVMGSCRLGTNSVLIIHLEGRYFLLPRRRSWSVLMALVIAGRPNCSKFEGATRTLRTTRPGCAPVITLRV